MADISVPHVHEITGLEAARDLRDSSVLVVDRASWAKANTQSFAVMLKPAMEKMLESRRGHHQPRRRQRQRRHHRQPAGRRPGLPLQQGPGPVRSLLGARRKLHRTRRRAAPAGGPQHHLRGARTQRRARGLPAVGLPARTDPPGAVRRRTLAAAPHAGRDRQPQRTPAGQRRFPDGTGLGRGAVAQGPHGRRNGARAAAPSWTCCRTRRKRPPSRT